MHSDYCNPAPPPLPWASAASSAAASPWASAASSPQLLRLLRRGAQHHRLRIARWPPPRRLQRLSCRRTASHVLCLTWRPAARHHCLRLMRRPPLQRLRQLSHRRAAPRPPRLAWRRTAQLASLDATLLSARPAWRRAAQHHLLRLARRLPPRSRLGGSGGFRAAALASPRLAPRCSASSSSPRASTAASAAVVALSPPCCAALASPCLAPRCSAPSHSPRTSAAALTAAAALHRHAAPRLLRLA